MAERRFRELPRPSFRLIQPRFQAGAWVRPPFGKTVERLLDFLIR